YSMLVADAGICRATGRTSGTRISVPSEAIWTGLPLRTNSHTVLPGGGRNHIVSSFRPYRCMPRRTLIDSGRAEANCRSRYLRAAQGGRAGEMTGRGIDLPAIVLAFRRTIGQKWATTSVRGKHICSPEGRLRGQGLARFLRGFYLPPRC